MSARPVTRRRFLAVVAAGVGGLVTFNLLQVLGRIAGAATAASELTHARFAGLVGTSFEIGLAKGRTASLKLLDVTPIKPVGVPAPSGEGFSLHFGATAADGFGQDTYQVTHPSLGRFPVFLVPVGRAGPDRQYEAVFNRLWK